MDAHFQEPTKEEIDKLARLFSAWEWVVDPYFEGLEHVPEKGPGLYVMNHPRTTGPLDIPLFWRKLYYGKKVYLRALIDRSYFRYKSIGDFLTKYGIASASPEHCEEMFLDGNFVLVLPGGRRAAFRNKGEEHKVMWENRIGFARMAIKNHCPIIPVATLGMEECYDVIIDQHDLENSTIANGLMKTLNIDVKNIPPLLKGIGPTLLPKPERIYFKISAPIPVDKYDGDFEDEVKCQELKELVQAEVEKSLEYLLEYREKDKKRSLANRLWDKIW